MGLRSIGLPELVVICLVLGGGYRYLKSWVNVAALAGVGAMLGAFVGFLMRPAFPLVGQLDLDVVLSRGMNLTGVDRLMQSTAEQSCNYVLIGAVVGGSLFALLKGRTANQHPALAVATPSGSPSPPSSDVSFCTKCGKQLGAEMLFCGSCGKERK